MGKVHGISAPAPEAYRLRQRRCTMQSQLLAELPHMSGVYPFPMSYHQALIAPDSLDNAFLKLCITVLELDHQTASMDT